MEYERAGEVLYIPVCDEVLKPCIGKIFPTLETAMKFYENYAREVGFDPRIYGTKTVGEVITWRYVTCSREGKKNTDEADLTNARDGYINKRRRTLKRCECMARISFKYVFGVGYVVHNFDERHNHPMVEVQHKRFMRLNRKLDPVHQKFIVDCAKASFGPTLTFKLLNELLGGYDAVGCTVLEVRNFCRDMKAYIEGSDAQMLLNEMKRRKENCESFMYNFEVDSEEKLKRLFWCDPMSRRNYHLFGDVVVFDTTYHTNKYCMVFAPFTGKDNHGRPVTFAAGLLSNEDADSFTWLFNQFINCMGSAPRLILTDQDLGMRVAIGRVLPTTRHRWCMWHIMLKLSDKVSKELHANEEFKKSLNACVWSELIEPEEFEKQWHHIMDCFSLKDEDWFNDMYKLRKYWVPAFFRDFPMVGLMRTTSVSECENNFFKRYMKHRSNLIEFIMSFNHAIEAQRNQSDKLNFMDTSMVPIMATKLSLEKHASTIYTDSMFKIVQVELVEACFECRMIEMSNGENCEQFNVEENQHKTFTVTYDEVQDSYMYKYIIGRWLKISLVKAVHDVICQELEVQSGVDEKRKMLNKLYSSFFGLVQKVEGNIDNIASLLGTIEDAEKSMFGDGTVLSVTDKKKIIEDLYGCQKPDVVYIHPPNVVKTKGSGSRLVSRKEKKMKEWNKPLRQCKKCLEMGHHDSRNCHKIKERKNEKCTSQA